MRRPKVSFAVGTKREASELLNNPTAPAAITASAESPNSSPRHTSGALVTPPESLSTAEAGYHQRETLPAHEPSKKNPLIVTTSTDPVTKKFQSGATSKPVDQPG